MANSIDSINHGATSPILTLTPPPSDENVETGDNASGFLEPAWPILILPTPLTGENIEAGDSDITDREVESLNLTLPSPPRLTLPAPLSDGDSVEGNIEVSDDPAMSPILTLPTPLSDSNDALYRRIFALQETGKWRHADRLIAKLDDKLLLGHVMAQRYLHPTSYRSRFSELAAWLRKFADHPEAKRIYKLAVQRKLGRASTPRAPRTKPPIFHGESGNGGYEPTLLDGRKYSRR
ncbi:MAG: hypothetical protein O3C34_12955, partial [Proteobacteria bacterium]|nr:hypothetical protein [Pseudomonadota bacterium]